MATMFDLSNFEGNIFGLIWEAFKFEVKLIM